MAQYENYRDKLAGRCLGILESFEQEAEKQKKEVTLLLMVATSAFVITRGRTLHDHPGSDSAFFEEDLSGSKKGELNTTWGKSSLSKDTGGWKYGFTKEFGKEASCWPSADMNAEENNVSEVLAIIRNALAHGNLYTVDDPIQFLRLYSKKPGKETCEKCERPVGPPIGYRYLDIPVRGFKQFLSNWLKLLRPSDNQP